MALLITQKKNTFFHIPTVKHSLNYHLISPEINNKSRVALLSTLSTEFAKTLFQSEYVIKIRQNIAHSIWYRTTPVYTFISIIFKGLVLPFIQLDPAVLSSLEMELPRIFMHKVMNPHLSF